MPETTQLSLPVLPLPTGVVLPGMVITIAVESEDAAAAVAAAGDEGRLLIVPQVDGRHARVGTVARIESRGSLPSGVPALVVRASQRAQLRVASAESSTVLWLNAVAVEPEVTERARELAVELRAAYRVLLGERGGARMADALGGLEDPGALADAAGWWPELSQERKVELLETIDVEERVEKVLGWVREVLVESEVAERIRNEVSENLDRTQREFVLRQQLAAIRKELGEGEDGGDAEGSAEWFRTRLAERDLPEDVRAAAEREVDRLERAGEQSPEHGWIRTWLDTVLGLPWAEHSRDRLDLVRAREVLDADHTGLDEVKDRIVEELAIRKLRAQRAQPDQRGSTSTQASAGPDSDRDGGSSGSDGTGSDDTGSDDTPARHGTILTLVGPPGVGKTSVGESIARALDRRFVRVALGGVRDEAEIRGHRRTYVGAQPGRIVRAIAEAGTMNPVVLLDEIDKVGNDFRGDPSAALLEVLDPAQNHSFRDHYLELELDLSEVIFVATANQLETIAPPLLDRMEVVALDGYTEDEKVVIARDHLVRRQLRRAGLDDAEVRFTDDALRRIVQDHTREPGVRSLERAIAKVLRKVATDVATRRDTDDATQPVVVDHDSVPELLGRARFHHTDIADRVAVPGVAAGLAVTGAGGDVLFVEATALPDDAAEGRSSLTVTGQLGDVMKESASIALSYVRSHRDDLGVPQGADRRHVHVHFPAGAIPKDGPSAGITMTTALVSLFTGRSVKANVAMTGEVTLQGRVLPIGGVKQKLLAAHRLGLTEVILPARNEADLDDVPEAVRDQLTVHLADDVADVVRLALEPAEQDAEVVAA
jgi:ATP-dependent Lon protease